MITSFFFIMLHFSISFLFPLLCCHYSRRYQAQKCVCYGKSAVLKYSHERMITQQPQAADLRIFMLPTEIQRRYELDMKQGSYKLRCECRCSLVCINCICVYSCTYSLSN